MGNFVLIFVAALVFLGFMASGSFLYWGMQARKASKRDELARRLGTRRSQRDWDQLFRATQEDPMVAQLGSVGQFLQSLTQQAGSSDTVSDVVLRCALFGLIGITFTIFFMDGFTASLGLFAASVPLIGLRSAADKRGKLISSQLPEGLDLVARTLRAGHGLSDSIRLVAEELPDPLGEEFAKVYQEHHLGRDMRACLELMAHRNASSFDLRLFVTSLILQRQTGGNLVEVLEKMASTVRERFVFHAKVKALTSEVRTSATVLCLMPIFVGGIMLLVRPEYLIPLIEEDLGQKLLIVTSSLYAGGILTMRQITKVDM